MGNTKLVSRMVLNFLSDYLNCNAPHKGMMSQQMCFSFNGPFYIPSYLLCFAVVDLFTSMQRSVKCRPNRNSSFCHSPCQCSSRMLKVLTRLKQWLISTLKLKSSGVYVYSWTWWS